MSEELIRYIIKCVPQLLIPPKSITVEPPEVKTYKYICTFCPDKCVLFSVEKGKVPTSCLKNEHRLAFWEETEQVFEIEFDGKIIKF